jgi:alpha-methylacyl-CoA racemase
LSESRAHWCSLMEGTDICFAPVLTLSEAPEHPHNRARNVFVNAFGVTQPAPSPRFSRTPGDIRRAPPAPGAHTEEVLKEWDVR